ncbi:nucleotidyltransferase family protein [Striga asiatica]|uniref:polynucleotide adenylyltransferase n=1 Tax=Striga asiatica TaxID=4170 RepID=A0A5A7QCQ8_STRAF|nr:nucleotidyltransferase family protein [Striga asiatica]
MVILYETLSPLGATEAAPASSQSKPYIVLRNQISVAGDGEPLRESAAPDYFSLDMKGAEDRETSVVAAPPPPPQLAETAAPAEERTPEGRWSRANYRFKSPMMRLHKEILDFCDFLSPTPEEQESRNAAVESVSGVIKFLWPSAEVEVFGSFKTGLYIPSSDIDVVILGSNVRSPQMGLRALSRTLSQRRIAKEIQVIAKARVPIIKFVERKSGVAFDISFDVQNGPKAADYVKDAVSKWPPLRPLCMILKVFLQQRELNEVYTGGIGSYALLSMLIAMLRTHHDRQASPERNLGVLLVNFFDMYGCKLNIVDVGVSCTGEGVFFPKSNKGFLVEGQPPLIAIEDPQAPDSDIGKNSFNYNQVKVFFNVIVGIGCDSASLAVGTKLFSYVGLRSLFKTWPIGKSDLNWGEGTTYARSAFALAFTTLTNPKALARIGPNKSILSTIIRLDAVLLNRKGRPSGNLVLGNLFPGTLADQLLVNGVAKLSGKKRKARKEKKKAVKKVAMAHGPDMSTAVQSVAGNLMVSVEGTSIQMCTVKGQMKPIALKVLGVLIFYGGMKNGVRALCKHSINLESVSLVPDRQATYLTIRLDMAKGPPGTDPARTRTGQTC